ncbi:MAG: PP0621 family protein [Caldimonas sp.]
MKFIVFLLAVFLLVWLLRGAIGRRSKGQAPPSTPGGAAAPQTIVACAYCGVHLPRDEALPGKGGVFCGDVHRTAFEKAGAAGS